MCNLPQSFSLHTTVQKNIQKPNTINIFFYPKKSTKDDKIQQYVHKA